MRMPLVWTLLLPSSSSSSVSCSHAQVSLLQLLLLWLPFGAVAETRPTANRQFFPNNADNTGTCDIPPYQDKAFVPQEGMCKSDTTISLAELLNNPSLLDRLAVAYAPYLYFHPLERFTMSAVNRTLDDPDMGKVFLNHADGIVLMDDTLNPQTLLDTTRNVDYALFSHLFFLEYQINDTSLLAYNAYNFNDTSVLDELLEEDDYRLGDGFEEETGRAVAPLYYNVYDSGNGTVTFNYHLYFTWSGPGNFGVLTSYNGTSQYTRILATPYGVHEGDWQMLSVTACPSSSDELPSPVAVTFRQDQGRFGQVYDCTAGECTFHETSVTHPVGFVALNTHDVYAMSVKELVYDEAWPLEFWVNLQGFLSIHRTSYLDDEGQFRRYEPVDATNVVRLAEPADIPQAVDPSDYWIAFGGQWGRPTTNQTLFGSDQIPLCLDNATTNVVDCPTAAENPIYDIVLQLMGILKPTTPLIEGASLLVDFLNSNQLGVAAYGPAAHPNYKALTLPGNAPLWSRPVINASDTGAIYCEKLLEIPDTFRTNPYHDILDVEETLYDVILMCALFTIGSVVYFIGLKFIEVRQVFQTDEQGNILPPKFKHDKLWVYHWAIVYSGSYVVAAVGFVLFFIGHYHLFELLNEFFGSSYDQLITLFRLIGALLMLIDTFLLILIWLRCEDTWRTMQRTYFEILGDDQGRAAFEASLRCALDTPKVVMWYAVTMGLTLTCLLFATLMAVLGVISAGMAYAIGEICRDIVGSLEGICFDFKLFGMDSVQCGEEFFTFCNGTTLSMLHVCVCVLSKMPCRVQSLNSLIGCTIVLLFSLSIYTRFRALLLQNGHNEKLC